MLTSSQKKSITVMQLIQQARGLYQPTWTLVVSKIHRSGEITLPGDATLEIPNANQFTEEVYYCNATNTAGLRAIPTYLDISG